MNTRQTLLYLALPLQVLSDISSDWHHITGSHFVCSHVMWAEKLIFVGTHF